MSITPQITSVLSILSTAPIQGQPSEPENQPLDDMGFRSESPERHDLTACPAPALERTALPPRKAWTPREVAAYLLGASTRFEVARRGELELRRVSGESVTRYLVTWTVDGSVTPCATPREVIAVVAEVLS